MKLAVLGESPADEDAVRILVDALLARKTEAVAFFPLRSRGWPSVRDVLPAVLKHLHYRTDADGLALVVDSNHSPVHRVEHETAGNHGPRCRYCGLRSVALDTLQKASPVTGRRVLRFAVGIAVPSIEAWYASPHNAGVSEAAWVSRSRPAADPYTKSQLKREVYGTDRPSLSLEKDIAVERARQVAGNLAALETAFPAGFGVFAREIRNW